MGLSESEYMLLVIWVESVTPVEPVCVTASDVVLLVMVALAAARLLPNPRRILCVLRSCPMISCATSPLFATTINANLPFMTNIHHKFIIIISNMSLVSANVSVCHVTQNKIYMTLLNQWQVWLMSHLRYFEIVQQNHLLTRDLNYVWSMETWGLLRHKHR